MAPDKGDGPPTVARPGMPATSSQKYVEPSSASTPAPGTAGMPWATRGSMAGVEKIDSDLSELESLVLGPLGMTFQEFERESDEYPTWERIMLHYPSFSTADE